ncbi:hypothetical protein GCM10010435_80700 [Winogradskya consettensis]|uniref:Pyrrolo-quinoline quinone repeat domain-containing protein n=2 Tax=Winogradskya consettensis TaxID=113560 RepID=A0A919STB7_9ACTN|nr:hypothetical protein Aco04nite_54280 [Actinoplanes consettensis]
MAELLWTRPLHMRAQAMTAAPGSLLVTERWTRLARLDPATGKQLWSSRVEDCWGTTVTTADRCLYLSQAGVLHCFDLRTGQPLWSRPDLQFGHHVTVSNTDVFIGGWRGYRPMTRLSLTDGTALPFTCTPLTDGGTLVTDLGPIATPLPIRLGPEGAAAVLVAGRNRPVLLALAPTGAVLAEWPLPEPMYFPDSGSPYSAGTFLSGRRTVMAFHPDQGVQLLWTHERDLAARAPMRDGRTLWLADETGIAVVDLVRGVIAEIEHRDHGGICASSVVAGRALIAFTDGSLMTVDRTGAMTSVLRVRGHVSYLIPGTGGHLHAIAKGHLLTMRFRVPDPA